MKRIFSMAAFVFSMAVYGQQVKEDCLFLLAGSANPQEKEAIQLYEFNQETGDFSFVCGVSGIQSPTFLCTNKKESIVYAVGESDDADQATLNALHLDKSEGKLELFQRIPNGAGAPCNISLNPEGDHLFCANYWGGSLTDFPLAKDGSLQPPSELKYKGSGPHRNQTQPHLHAVNFTPDDKYLLLNDLGLDCIHVYPLNKHDAYESVPPFDVTKGYEVKVDLGAGPRHLCWAPDGIHAYLISELSGQLFTLRYEQEKLSVQHAVVADENHGGGSADIHITKDGRFLYASHRLKEDGLSIWQVDSKTGDLKRIGYQKTGIHPRNFALTPNDKFVLVACRDSDEIQIFERNAATGLLTDTGQKIAFGKPMFVKFLQK